MWEVITPPSHQCSNNEWTAEVQCAILAGCFFFRFYFQVFRISLWPTIGSPPTHVFLCSIDILVFLSEHCDRWPVWSPTFPIQVSENGKSYPISIPIIVTLISQTSARELDHCCGCQGHGAGDAREHLVRGRTSPRSGCHGCDRSPQGAWMQAALLYTMYHIWDWEANPRKYL